jgi:hypothetical protein
VASPEIIAQLPDDAGLTVVRFWTTVESGELVRRAPMIQRTQRDNATY